MDDPSRGSHRFPPPRLRGRSKPKRGSSPRHFLIAMSEVYFEKAPATFEGYNITSDQIQTLRASVNGTLPPQKAARQLTRYPESSPTPVEMKTRLGGLWTLLNDTAVLLPSSQPAVIAILQTVRDLPRAPEPHGEGEGCVDLGDGF